MFGLHRIFHALLEIQRKEDLIILEQQAIRKRIQNQNTEINNKLDKLQKSVDALQPKPPQATHLVIEED